MQYIKLIKLEEVENPTHPNNRPVGDYHQGLYVEMPHLGRRFWCGNNWSTSVVTEIIDSNTFKTLNSLYRWEFIENLNSL